MQVWDNVDTRWTGIGSVSGVDSVGCLRLSSIAMQLDRSPVLELDHSPAPSLIIILCIVTSHTAM